MVSVPLGYFTSGLTTTVVKTIRPPSKGMLGFFSN